MMEPLSSFDKEANDMESCRRYHPPTELKDHNWNEKHHQSINRKQTSTSIVRNHSLKSEKCHKLYSRSKDNENNRYGRKIKSSCRGSPQFLKESTQPILSEYDSENPEGTSSNCSTQTKRMSNLQSDDNSLNLESSENYLHSNKKSQCNTVSIVNNENNRNRFLANILHSKTQRCEESLRVERKMILAV